MAQPLYKWQEADGSITFSPTKPPRGIDFQVINAVDGVSPSTIVQRASSNETGQAAAVQNPQIQFSQSKMQTQTDPGAQSVSASASADDEQFNGSQSIPWNFGSQAVQRTAASAASIEKQHQCENLRKRVVSLERRLKSHLSAEDMDNTIIHMSRYQRSFDQNCL